MVNTEDHVRQDQRKAALTAGLSLIIMAVAAAFSFSYVHGSLVVPGDPGATYQHLQASNLLFRAEILGWLIILICDIAAAWGFYLFLKPVHASLSLLAAWLRLAYAAILGIAIMNLVLVMHLASTADDLPAMPLDQLQALIMLFLSGFETIWSVGLIIFGGHLMIAGYVALLSDRIPKIIGVLLAIAGIGYAAIHLCSVFLPELDGFVTVLEYVLMLPMIAGELGFGLWLLIRGTKLTRSIW